MVKIDELSQCDCLKIFELESKLLGKCSLDDIKKTIDSKTLFYKVLKVDNMVAGFYEVSIISPDAEIFDICVDENFQGNGYGKMLLENLICFAKTSNCETIFLEVNSINSKAINLYTKFGFKVYSTRKKYYGENDAILMKLDLN